VYRRIYMAGGKAVRSKSWTLLWYERGRKQTLTFEGTRAEAVELLDRKTASKRLRRRARAGGATNHVRLADVAVEYREDISLRLRPRTCEEYGRAIDRMLEDLPVDWIDDLSADLVKSWAARAMQGVKAIGARTVNIHIGALKTMLSWAVASRLIESNPVKEVKPVRRVTAKKYRRALTDAEVDRLLEASPKGYRGMWLVFLHTGLRKGELTRLRWEHVDLERAEIHLTEDLDKGGKEHWLPLTAEARGVFEGLWEGQAGDGFCFVNRAGRPWRNNLLSRFRACVRAAGIDEHGVDIHALRYTFATSLLRNGVDPATAARLTRHADVRILLEIYRHVSPTDKRGAVERLSIGRNGRNPGAGRDRAGKVVS